MTARSPKSLSALLPRGAKARAAVALTALALAAGTVALVRASGPRAASGPVSEGELSLRYEPGTTLHYTVAWSGTQSGRLFAESAGAEQTHTTTKVDMALGMDLYVESRSGEDATIRLSFTNVERHGLSVLNAEVFPTPDDAAAALLGRSAKVRVGSNGEPYDVAFEDGAPDIFMNTVQWIVAQSTLSLGASGRIAEWDASERGPFGSSEVHYRRRGSELERSRVRYDSFDAFASRDATELSVGELDGHSTIVMKDASIGAIHTEETLRIDTKSGKSELDGHIVFDLKLERVTRGGHVLAAASFGAPVKAGEAIVGQDTREQLLSQRIDGMTREKLLADVKSMANGGVMPAHTKWLWRATGLLQKDPSIARDLAALALAPDATDKGRALVLDVLASVGHAEAQAEMRRILGSPALAKSGARTALVQRVSFLDAPEPATLDTVWAALREGKQKGSGDLVAASAHSLAAASRAMASRGDEAGARSTVQRLASEIDQAKTPEEKAAVLSSLGNASSSLVTSIAKPYASSDSVDFREAAADAVRKVDTREATEMLLELLGDPNPSVQGAALASLRDRTLEPSDWQRIAEIFASGRLSSAFDGAMLTLADAYLGRVHVVGQIVAGIASRPEASNATRARARAMLSSAPG